MGSKNPAFGKGPNFGKKLSDEHKEKLRQKKLGKNNPNFGKHFSQDHCQKIAQSNLGQTRSDETRAKIRLSIIKHIKKLKKLGNMRPNFNPLACKIIDEYGKQNGLNFQHALNEGEFFVKDLGYWIDGYDKEKNIAIEYYERWHDKSRERKYDEYRKSQIIKKLNCQFIELRESNG